MNDRDRDTDPAPTALGTPLKRRHGFVVALAGVGALFLAVVATAEEFHSTDPAALLMTGLTVTFLVLVPLLGAYWLSRLRLFVSAEAVSSRLGRFGQSLSWEQVNRVEVRWAPGTGVMPRRRSITVFVDAPGQGTRYIIATETQFDLEPLLAHVLEQCDRRPDLLRTDEDRVTLVEFAATYGLR